MTDAWAEAPRDTAMCDVCGRVLDIDKGEAFLTDEGGTYCNDHYPEPWVGSQDVRTVADLRATLNDPRHLGYGYAECVRYLPAGKLARLDRAIAAVATELGLTWEGLFQWSNSKYGRWLADGVSGNGEPPTRETVRRLLNAEVMERLADER